MQADGWVLRSRMPGGAEVMPWQDVGIEPDIVWWKKSCMPESVRDRPTVDFEDVLIFSQQKTYFWDQEAGREPLHGASDEHHARYHSDGRYNLKAETTSGGAHSGLQSSRELGMGRNMRSVWIINPEPTDEEHFAAWPVALAARLIKVMTSEKGVCPECGAPWMREVEQERGWKSGIADERPSGLQTGGRGSSGLGTCAGAAGWSSHGPRHTTVGWRPLCDHYDDLYRLRPRSEKLNRRRAEDATGTWWARVRQRPGADDWLAEVTTVLDPFAGLGRTWEACRETGRRFIGADLGLSYCQMALARNDLEAMAKRRQRPPPEDWGPLFAEE
ncbi:MAG: DNA methyltransferase, partial [Longimicrobiales bacterium]